jgi:hypothetical protein
MRTVKEWTVIAVGVLSLPLMACRVDAQTTAPVQARNVVLVHGAWADGSCRGSSTGRERGFRGPIG